MISEEEQIEFDQMVTELEALSESSRPGFLAAYVKLNMLAKATGDDWVILVRAFLSQRRENAKGKGQ